MVRQRNRTISFVIALLLTLAQVLPSIAQSESQTVPADPVIRVGSKTFAEQRLLGKMIVILLQEAGYPVEDMTNLGGSAVVRDALENGEIDLYPEYTGTALTLYNNLPADALPNVAERVYELIKTLDEPRGLIWLDPALVNNTFALIARTELQAEEIATIGDLATYVTENSSALTICMESDFYGRADGLSGLEELYDFRFPEDNILIMDSDETYTNLRDGSCDVAQGIATDGRIQAWDFYALDDNLAFFPFYQLAPVVRSEILDAYPDVADLLGELTALLDNETMIELNALTEYGADGLSDSGDEEAVEDVAYAFLTANGLVKPPAIRVGSKEFTEQLILGKLFVLLLRDAGYEVEDLTGYGGTTLIRQAVEAGEIDIYPEYNGTATSVHHNIPVTALPTTAERAYALARSLDAPLGLVWLDAMPFNNTYTLMVGQDLIDEGVRSIDDLAVYMNANDAPLSICVEGEFYSRPDGLDGLQALYGFAFQEEKIQVMETSETYSKLRDGDCDVAEGFATDGRISAWNFTNLQDSLAFFPFYNPTPVVRKEVLDLHPEIAVLLNNLSRLIDEPTMSELNARVDIGADGILGNGDEESVEDVAYSFLRANRLIALPEIAVSVIDADEGFHALLGEMLTLVLDDAGYQVVDKTDLGSSSIVRQAMLDGEVDLYLESVVTALSEYQNLPISALPTTKERAYLLAQTLDQANDIVWLDLMPYEETYAIIVADALDDEEITSLDDFALYMNANDSPLTICMNNEFYGSKLNGLSSLEALYGFNFQPDNILLMETEAIFDALDAGDCDVAAASTDAADRGYTVLDDPLEFFLSFGSAPVVRQEILDQNPELAVLLNNLVARLDAETVGQLDRQVELGADGEESSGDELDAYTVALDFLVDAGLIEPPAEDASDSGTDEGAADDSSTSQETPPSIGDEQPVVPSPADDGSDTGSGSVTPEAPALTQRSPQTTGVTSRPIVPTVAIASSAGARPSAVTKDLNATIDVGSMADTEQRLMGAMLVAMLRDAGYPVVDRTASGTSPDLRAMLEAGEIDIYPEFTGVALSLYHNIPPSALPTTAEGAFSLIQRLDTAFNIAWIRKASFDSAYGLAVSAQLAGEGFRTLFDLAEAVRVSQRSLTICADEEFANDEELGLPSVATIYDIELNPATITILPSEEIYQALRAGTCDVGAVQRTDGRIAAWDLYVLEDSLGAFPNYSPAPVIRRDLLTRYPELESYLDQLGPTLSSAAITALNAQVDLGADGEAATGDEASVEAVASTFLCENALIQTCGDAIDRTTSATTVVTESTSLTPVLAMIPLTISPTLAVSSTAENGVINDDAADAADTPAVAEQASFSVTVTTPNTFGVNVRTTANAGAEVVTVVPRNTTVQVTGRTDDGSWLQIITTEGEVAWVFTAAVLTRSGTIEQLPIVVPPAVESTP